MDPILTNDNEKKDNTFNNSFILHKRDSFYCTEMLKNYYLDKEVYDKIADDEVTYSKSFNNIDIIHGTLNGILRILLKGISKNKQIVENIHQFFICHSKWVSTDLIIENLLEISKGEIDYSIEISLLIREWVICSKKTNIYELENNEFIKKSLEKVERFQIETKKIILQNNHSNFKNKVIEKFKEITNEEICNTLMILDLIELKSIPIEEFFKTKWNQNSWQKNKVCQVLEEENNKNFSLPTSTNNSPNMSPSLSPRNETNSPVSSPNSSSNSGEINFGEKKSKNNNNNNDNNNNNNNNNNNHKKTMEIILPTTPPFLKTNHLPNFNQTSPVIKTNIPIINQITPLKGNLPNISDIIVSSDEREFSNEEKIFEKKFSTLTSKSKSGYANINLLKNKFLAKSRRRTFSASSTINLQNELKILNTSSSSLKTLSPSSVPNVWLSAKRWSKLVRWTSTQILEEITSYKRSKVIKRFIKIAAMLWEKRNYHSCMAIVSSLQSFPISRLEKSFKKIPQKHMTIFEEITKQLSHTKNFFSYHNIVKDCIRENKSYIPFLGCTTKDFQATEDGNDDWFVNKDKNKRKEINFEKVKIYGSIVNSFYFGINKMVPSLNSDERSKSIYNFLHNLADTHSEEILINLSQKLEKKN